MASDIWSESNTSLFEYFILIKVLPLNINILNAHQMNKFLQCLAIRVEMWRQ